MIVRLNPWFGHDDNLVRFRRNFDHLFNNFFSRDTEYNGSSNPQINMYDTGDSISVSSELPGMNKDDIKIVVKHDILTISGKRELPEKPENVHWLRHERFHGDFSRSFKLPYDIQVDNVKAEFKDGILSVNLPKKEELKPQEIQVK